MALFVAALSLLLSMLSGLFAMVKRQGDAAHNSMYWIACTKLRKPLPELKLATFGKNDGMHGLLPDEPGFTGFDSSD
ncbi:hypothetical protein ACQ4M4_21990 [Leptolyngbya sp. AN02str]|uniref:hypothetical protein n=1 Tax=Leptolyngbya sp. AN02str TaxID=3423363 RepID=UPI003D316AA4